MTESIESFRVRQKSAMQEFFNEDPFASEAERAAQMMDDSLVSANALIKENETGDYLDRIIWRSDCQ